MSCLHLLNQVSVRGVGERSLGPRISASLLCARSVASTDPGTGPLQPVCRPDELPWKPPSSHTKKAQGKTNTKAPKLLNAQAEGHNKKCFHFTRKPSFDPKVCCALLEITVATAWAGSRLRGRGGRAGRYREGPSGSGTVGVSGVPTICHFPGSQETPEGNTTPCASKCKTPSPLFTQETAVSANLEPKNWSHRGGSGRGHSTQRYWTLQGELPTQAGPTVPPGCLSRRG